MKSPSDPGLLRDSTSLHNFTSQNISKEYGTPLSIFFYDRSVLQLISHKKYPQNVAHIRIKKIIGMERLICMRTNSPDKEYFEIQFQNFFLSKSNQIWM